MGEQSDHNRHWDVGVHDLGCGLWPQTVEYLRLANFLDSVLRFLV